MAITFPASPATGQEYVATNGRIYFYDGTGWTTRARDITPDPFLVNPFRYRSIYTRGYVSAGYQNSSPWKNVNRTVHATDTTTNLGDQLDQIGAYLDGGHSDYYQYVYGLAGSFQASATHTSGLNMATEVGRTNSTWDMKTGRVFHVAIMNPSLTAAYITGGNTTATDKHNYATETMYAAGTVPNNPSVAGNCTKMLGQYRGWVIGSGTAAWIDFTTETWTNGGITSGTDGYSKVLSSKNGFGWGKSGTNTATTSITRWSDVTGTSYGVVCYSPDLGGEENMQVGQNWGYQLGNYNGAQNNNTYKLTYASDTCTGMGSATQPSGHGGMSSGCCASASATILGGY
jgi:hypothetical protein